MTWESLYPIVKEQAYYAVLRYEEPERRKDKIQELVCQAYELYKSYIERGKPIRKQDFKAFITQRAKQIDLRSVCKKGLGGTSTIDVLSFYRRRSDSATPVLQFDEWMTGSVYNKEVVDSTLAFNLDFKSWLEKLSDMQREVLDLLIEGYKASKIAEKIHQSAGTVRSIIKQMKEFFVRFFHIKAQYA
jgi:hypothetical protein